ncbi:KpsF/GutQ family sugar-phosphate isomerase [Halanaerobiaceae bacterium Z-7014]|uniref:KpsF/GutQ family sugar-phosphate isomerase n=1 Tax=Halonatronomonas betaini TaxID=2778430 RepID=A0A931AWM8_9FIRM|nr:KpsF/GutQ family sugar-phosphate isomerase [Halonatronomonas betaini]MBF8437446.1 KpsF/GutQ family sugar-phosphate isomerase [Halonatronomonas betaini]
MARKNIDPNKIKQALNQARQVLINEATAVKNLAEEIDGNFSEFLSGIYLSEGRIILTGVGKSGLIARKIAATFSSTGTPAYFVHAGEALHGDLGMVTGEDIIITISNSGETEEIIKLIPSIKRIGARLYLITSNLDSTLANQADSVISTGVTGEACHLDLAPTTSTTASLALGDALAVSLAGLNGLTEEDFALYHPAGSLGRKLLTTVADVLKIRDQNPKIKAEASVQQALFTMTESRMGSTAVINQAGRLIGIVTDGDIRRAVKSQNKDLLNARVSEIMTADPETIGEEKLAAEALKLMEQKEINHLPIIDDNGSPLGMVNFQDLLRAKVW